MFTHILESPPSPLWRLKRSLEQPGESQRRLLQILVRQAKNTAWGRRFGFEDLERSPDIIREFQRRVPLSDYGDLAPCIDRVVHGEPDVIWPGCPAAFAVSGGTRSGGRVIPLSRATMACLSRSSLLPGLCYISSKRGGWAILKGKILSLPGGVETGSVQGKLTGEVSGMLAYYAPRLLSYRLQALPRRVMLMEDWELKLRESARIAVRKDVRSLAMVPSWAPVFLERVREVAGTATVLEAVAKTWPNFKVFFSGGVALSSFRSVLQSYLGASVDFIESYSASEGLFAFQDRCDDESLLVNLIGGVFFEFVRLGDEHSSRPVRHTIGTIEPGVDYIIYVTNLSGLWSLCIGDIVRFVSIHPPRLLVMGRVGETLDRYGDATSVDHARRAIAAADKTCCVRCLGFHLTYADPVESKIPRHHWVLEFDTMPDNIASYARSIDEFMKQANGRYRTRREPGAMAAPVVTTVPLGSCAEYLRSARKRLSGQSKIVNVSEDRSIAESLLSKAREINRSSVRTVCIE